MKTILLIVACLTLSACDGPPKTPAEKKAVAETIVQAEDTAKEFVPFPWDLLIYTVGSISAATLGVGAAYRKIRKPKAVKTP